MIRVETEQSQAVIDQLESINEKINWNGNEYIGNRNGFLFAVVHSQSTRSIYIRVHDIHSEDTKEIRVSDHRPSDKVSHEESVVYRTFETFDINEVVAMIPTQIN